MPVVFELYNADGTLQLNISSRITKVLSFQRITAAGSYVSEAFGKGTMFFSFTLEAGTSTFTGFPAVAQNGNTVSWTAPPVPMYLVLGIY